MHSLLFGAPAASPIIGTDHPGTQFGATPSSASSAGPLGWSADGLAGHWSAGGLAGHWSAGGLAGHWSAGVAGQ